jgi:hypothetical protein
MKAIFEWIKNQRVAYNRQIKAHLCNHTWTMYTVECVTLAPKERRCTECGKIQKAKITWID